MCFVHFVALANWKSLSELTALPYGGIVSEEYIYTYLFRENKKCSDILAIVILNSAQA